MQTIKVEKTEEFLECVSDYCDDDYEFEFVIATDWIQDYKYQYRDIILKRKSDGTFWRHSEMRTGSPFTDWHYEGDSDATVTLVQVKEVEVVVKKWEVA